MVALKVTGLMAKCLRKNFSQAVKLLFPYIIEKLKDKKTLMIEETFTTIESFFVVIGLEEVYDVVEKQLGDKNSAYKINILKLLEKYSDFLKDKEKKKSEGFFKTLIVKLKVMIDDGDVKVRD